MNFGDNEKRRQGERNAWFHSLHTGSMYQPSNTSSGVVGQNLLASSCIFHAFLNEFLDVTIIMPPCVASWQ